MIYDENDKVLIYVLDHNKVVHNREIVVLKLNVEVVKIVNYGFKDEDIVETKIN